MSIKFSSLIILLCFTVDAHAIDSEAEIQIAQFEKEKTIAYSYMHFSVGGIIGATLNAILSGQVFTTSTLRDQLLPDSLFVAMAKRNFNQCGDLNRNLLDRQKGFSQNQLLTESYARKKHRWLHYTRSFFLGVAAGAAAPSAIKTAMNNENLKLEELYGPSVVTTAALATAGLLSLEIRRTACHIERQNSPIKNV